LRLEEAAIFIVIMSIVKKIIAIVIASNIAQNPEILMGNTKILLPVLPSTYGFFDMLARLETPHYLFFICCFLVSLFFVAQNKKQLEIYFFMACSVIPLTLLIINPPNLMFFYLLLEFSTLSTTVLLVSRRYNPFAVSAGLMYYFVSIFVSLLLLIGIFFYFLEYETLELVTPNKMNDLIKFEFNNLFKF
jgi:formate hydrogenlyase subunit 3/multisubunit Na+/H+ antiporter MnhD subunit